MYSRKEGTTLKVWDSLEGWGLLIIQVGDISLGIWVPGEPVSGLKLHRHLVCKELLGPSQEKEAAPGERGP